MKSAGQRVLFIASQIVPENASCFLLDIPDVKKSLEPAQLTNINNQ